MIDYSKIMNKNVHDLPPSGIRKFFDVANEMENAISLGVGEPDFATPWDVRNYAIKTIQAGQTQYTSNAGKIELREMIAKYLKTRFDFDYDPKKEMIVTVGASEGIDLSLRTILESGDEVLVPNPSYVSYAPNVVLAGGKPVSLLTTIDDEFKITPQNLEKAITNKTKALILPYPNNPTGSIMTRDDLLKIAPIIKKHNIMVISDEIYAELTYGRKHESILNIDGMWERTILISGFSKAFAMTGWRIGFVCAPSELIKGMLKIHQYTIMCVSTPAQNAGYYAIKSGLEDNFASITKMRDEYDIRRKYLVSSFRDMGLDCFEPRGAFYVFPCVKSLSMTGDEFAEKLLYSKKLAVVPGSAFGSSGKYFIRCSYAYSIKDLQLAVERIRQFVAERNQKSPI